MEIKEIIHFEELDSTNSKLHKMAEEGAEEGTVIMANCQTAGKGRRGRTWESAAGKNLYMSILLRPKLDAAKAPMLTLVMAYAIVKELRNKTSLDLQIKWPNDIVANGKKLCGILTEMFMDGSAIDHVIIGVGVNVNGRIFSHELAGKATSLSLEDGKTYNLKELAKMLSESFAKQYEKFMEHSDLSYLKEEYNALLVNFKREVCICSAESERKAFAHGINANGELLVEYADGTMEAIYAGEVSVRGIYGYV